jgi:hypothetical protein
VNFHSFFYLPTWGFYLFLLDFHRIIFLFRGFCSILESLLLCRISVFFHQITIWKPFAFAITCSASVVEYVGDSGAFSYFRGLITKDGQIYSERDCQSKSQVWI